MATQSQCNTPCSIDSIDRLKCPNCNRQGCHTERVDDEDCYWCNGCGWDWQVPVNECEFRSKVRRLSAVYGLQGDCLEFKVLLEQVAIELDLI